MPSVPLVLAPLTIAVVLVWSALAKWPEPDATRSAAALLRLPAALQTRWFARALPVAEVMLAVLLLVPVAPIARWAAVAAVALFAAYFVVIARAMTFSPRPRCGCFGRIGDHTVTWRTVARNALLLALAVIGAFWSDGETVPSTLAGFARADWVWLLGAFLLAALVLLIVARPAPASHAADPPSTSPLGAPVATPEPAPGDGDEFDYLRLPIPLVSLLDPQGAPRLLTEMARQKAQLLILANCLCGPTAVAYAETPGWRTRVPAVDVRFVYSSFSAPPPDLGTDTWRDHGGVAWAALGLAESPAAVLVGADGLLAGGPVSGVDAIREFVAEVEVALSAAR